MRTGAAPSPRHPGQLSTRAVPARRWAPATTAASPCRRVARPGARPCRSCSRYRTRPLRWRRPGEAAVQRRPGSRRPAGEDRPFCWCCGRPRPGSGTADPAGRRRRCRGGPAPGRCAATPMAARAGAGRRAAGHGERRRPVDVRVEPAARECGRCPRQVRRQKK